MGISFDIAENPLIPMGAITGRPSHQALTETLTAWRSVGVTQFLIYARSGCELEYLSEEWFDMCEWVCREARRLEFTSIWLYDEFNWPSGTCHLRVPAEDEAQASAYLSVRRSGEGYEVAVRHDRGMSNLLSGETVDRFIQLTHERYAERLKEYMGTLIKGFFTDEPDIAFFRSQPEDLVTIPWYEGLEEAYGAITGNDLREDMICGLKTGSRPYESVCNRLFAETFRRNYAERLSRWGAAHGVVLTGHLMNEYSSSLALRCNGHPLPVLSSFSFPGMDEIFTHGRLGSMEWLTFGTVMHAIEKSGSGGGLAELFALGPCDLSHERIRKQLWTVAAFGVSRYVLAVSALDMRGNIEKPYYFNPTTSTQPWFPCFRELGAEAVTAAAFARKGKVFDVGIRYPYAPAPLTSVLKYLVSRQFSWRLLMPDEPTDLPVVLSLVDGQVVEEVSGQRHFDVWSLDEALLSRLPRKVCVYESGVLASDVFVRLCDDGSVLVVNLAGRARSLTVCCGEHSASFDLSADGIRYLDDWGAVEGEPEVVSRVPLGGKVTLDRVNTCRCEFADGVFRFEVCEELSPVWLAIRQYGAVPEIELDGQLVSCQEPCDKLPAGFAPLYRESQALTVGAGVHEIRCVNGAPDYPYLPSVFVLGDFCQSRDHRLGQDASLGLYGYCGLMSQEECVDVPADARCLEVNPEGLCTEAFLDGCSLGRQLWPPFRWKLPEESRGGRHRLTVVRYTSCGQLFGEASFQHAKQPWLGMYRPRNERGFQPIAELVFLK